MAGQHFPATHPRKNGSPMMNSRDPDRRVLPSLALCFRAPLLHGDIKIRYFAGWDRRGLSLKDRWAAAEGAEEEVAAAMCCASVRVRQRGAGQPERRPCLPPPVPTARARLNSSLGLEPGDGLST
ncbi:hypothetical protein SKAU_G00140790 [Synaphobranchus kaupii]|uniref:Uncharacterized protein n=1 Tax=Synaphobranchus kaupii TaxID=118154 RepID=A0A9Q1FSF8_SYNKA|nr:hypothetical protein SKAU_G00140790 [Synaphobranchus kaupii]